MMLYLSPIETPLGTMIAVANEHALYVLNFTDCGDTHYEIERVRKKTQANIVTGKTVVIISIEDELKKYFNGTLQQFETPLASLGTPFQNQVWKTLQHIPFGETGSYAQVACAIGKPTAFRAVANANGSNRLAIIIPCHRVIKSNGDLCGYNGGVSRKQWLINHEKRLAKSS